MPGKRLSRQLCLGPRGGPCGQTGHDLPTTHVCRGLRETPRASQAEVTQGNSGDCRPCCPQASLAEPHPAPAPLGPLHPHFLITRLLSYRESPVPGQPQVGLCRLSLSRRLNSTSLKSTLGVPGRKSPLSCTRLGSHFVFSPDKTGQTCSAPPGRPHASPYLRSAATACPPAHAPRSEPPPLDLPVGWEVRWDALWFSVRRPVRCTRLGQG